MNPSPILLLLMMMTIQAKVEGTESVGRGEMEGIVMIKQRERREIRVVRD